MGHPSLFSHHLHTVNEAKQVAGNIKHPPTSVQALIIQSIMYSVHIFTTAARMFVHEISVLVPEAAVYSFILFFFFS